MVKLSYLLLVLSLVAACGKKSHNSAPLDVSQAYQPSLTSEQELTYKALKDAVKGNNISIVQELLSKNSDINLNQLNEDGETLLMFAIRKDFKEIRNLLISAKADLNKTSAVGETALIIAAKLGMADSVHRLIDERKLDDESHMDLNRQDAEGNTALIAAIKAKQTDIALELLRNGADYKIKDNDRYTPYQIAERLNLEKVIEQLDILIEAEAGLPSATTFAALLKTGGIKSITNLVKRFPQIVKLHEKINPLVIVLENQPINSVPVLITLLLQNNASVNGPADAAISPIVKTIQMNNIEYLKMLLSRRADVLVKDAQGKSTLVHAVEQNNPEIVDILRNYDVPKKYSLFIDGKKVKFNACVVAREVQKQLKDKADLDKNEKIKDALKCGLRFLLIF